MNASQRRTHEKYLLKKWGEQALDFQAKERLRGRIYTDQLSIARQLEAKANAQKAARRNQALRASGQKSEAQRDDRHSVRLLGPWDGQDVCEDFSFRTETQVGSHIIVWDEYTHVKDEAIDWYRYARLSAKELASFSMGKRHQEVRTPPHGGSKHGRQTRRSVRPAG